MGARIKAIPDWIWAPFSSAVLLLVCGALGIGFRQPWLFPSLGPSALLHAHHPKNPAARFYNTAVGHYLGMVAGFAAVFICGAASSAAVMSTENLSWPRVAASAAAIFLTIFAQIVFKAFHPPAAATTLLIALGVFKFGSREIQILIVGVLILATVGEGFRRVRL